MPLLDMSDVLTDPDFNDKLTCTRNVQTMVSGYAVNTPTTTNFYGVVTSSDGSQLHRDAAAAHVSQTISIVTMFKLTDGNSTISGVVSAADIVTWNGKQYTVRHVDDYSRFGRGFTQAIAELIPLSG